MGRLGILYRIDTCIACGACQTACKDGHGLLAGEYLRRVALVEAGGGTWPYSGACCHCAAPACAAACPTGAMRQLEEGAVIHQDGLCIGCGACVWACPYGAVSFSRAKGVSQKCDSCLARRRQGKRPLCVDACPTQSLLYGEWEALWGLGPADGPIFPFLPDPQITRPSLVIARRGEKRV